MKRSAFVVFAVSLLSACGPSGADTSGNYDSSPSTKKENLSTRFLAEYIGKYYRVTVSEVDGFRGDTKPRETLDIQASEHLELIRLKHIGNGKLCSYRANYLIRNVTERTEDEKKSDAYFANYSVAVELQDLTLVDSLRGGSSSDPDCRSAIDDSDAYSAKNPILLETVSDRHIRLQERGTNTPTAPNQRNALNGDGNFMKPAN